MRVRTVSSDPFDVPVAYPNEQDFVSHMTSEDLEMYLLKIAEDEISDISMFALMRDGIRELRLRRLARSAG